jgi:bidirectional [NiFe] hydrogenase diaphorase subunit
MLTKRTVGVPPREDRAGSTQRIMLRIDGDYVTTDPDRTVLDVAVEMGIDIPRLCAIPGLTPVGACRLCLVEVKGNNRLLPACTLKVEAGMVVATLSDRLERYRRMIIELLFAERNHVCAVCVSNGTCELQALATRLGVTHSSFAYRYPRLAVDATHKRFLADPNRCILCTRCVRVCGEVEGAHTWAVGGRGIDSHLVSDMADPWGEAGSCTSCGKCVQVCATGALTFKGRAVGEGGKRDWDVPDLLRMRKVRT